jgi:hypothetical protein
VLLLLLLLQVVGYSDGRLFTPKVGPQAAAPGSQGKFAHLLDSKVTIKPAASKQQHVCKEQQQQQQQQSLQPEGHQTDQQQESQQLFRESAAEDCSRGTDKLPASSQGAASR